jgi:hypothetical protein
MERGIQGHPQDCRSRWVRRSILVEALYADIFQDPLACCSDTIYCGRQPPT